MVNFNNENTISTPPGDVLKIAILERRAYFINAVEEFKKVDQRGGSASMHVVAAAAFALFLEVQEPLKKDLGEEKYKELRDIAINPPSIDKALEAFDQLSAFLYKKKLTMFDTRKEVDTEDVEAVNIEHGL